MFVLAFVYFVVIATEPRGTPNPATVESGKTHHISQYYMWLCYVNLVVRCYVMSCHVSVSVSILLLISSHVHLLVFVFSVLCVVSGKKTSCSDLTWHCWNQHSTNEKWSISNNLACNTFFPTHTCKINITQHNTHNTTRCNTRTWMCNRIIQDTNWHHSKYKQKQWIQHYTSRRPMFMFVAFVFATCWYVFMCCLLCFCSSCNICLYPSCYLYIHLPRTRSCDAIEMSMSTSMYMYQCIFRRRRVLVSWLLS